MSQEIVYTSAPQGLKPGSRGFCTVASTPGMAVTLAERLESLSGYRHLFSPQDAQARLNPVAWAHLQFSLGGRNYFVLSRIADAGLDYSQRSNKIAHHVALLGTELNDAGPAWTLGQPGFMVTRWDGPPRILPAGRVPPPEPSLPRVCSQWARVTGDPGWGGVLAETLETKREVFIAYAPGQELLPLVEESLALIAPAKRWEATFSTFYLRLPPGVTCQWKGVISGSEEALAAKRLPSALFLDLTAPLGSCPESKWVAAARSGQVPQPAAPPPRATSAKPLAAVTAAVLDTTPDPDLLIDEDPRVVLPPHRPPSRTQHVHGASGEAVPPPWTPPQAPNRWPWIAGGLALLAAAVSIGLVAERYLQSQGELAAKVENAISKRDAQPLRPSPDKVRPDEMQPRAPADAEAPSSHNPADVSAGDVRPSKSSSDENKPDSSEDQTKINGSPSTLTLKEKQSPSSETPADSPAKRPEPPSPEQFLDELRSLVQLEEMSGGDPFTPATGFICRGWSPKFSKLAGSMSLAFRNTSVQLDEVTGSDEMLRVWTWKVDPEFRIEMRDNHLAYVVSIQHYNHLRFAKLEVALGEHTAVIPLLKSQEVASASFIEREDGIAIELPDITLPPDVNPSRITVSRKTFVVEGLPPCLSFGFESRPDISKPSLLGTVFLHYNEVREKDVGLLVDRKYWQQRYKVDLVLKDNKLSNAPLKVKVLQPVPRQFLDVDLRKASQYEAVSSKLLTDVIGVDARNNHPWRNWYNKVAGNTDRIKVLDGQLMKAKDEEKGGIKREIEARENEIKEWNVFLQAMFPAPPAQLEKLKLAWFKQALDKARVHFELVVGPDELVLTRFGEKQAPSAEK